MDKKLRLFSGVNLVGSNLLKVISRRAEECPFQ